MGGFICNKNGKQCEYANPWHECISSTCVSKNETVNIANEVFRKTLKEIKDCSKEAMDSYCITFFPVVSGVIDPIGYQQVFLKLSEEKVKDLQDFFGRVNEDKNTKIKIFIEKFEINA